jgi:hypothetical protein
VNYNILNDKALSEAFIWQVMRLKIAIIILVYIIMLFITKRIRCALLHKPLASARMECTINPI